jgi:hypothetical protein
MKFTKSETKPDATSYLGSLDFQQLGLDIENTMKEVTFSQEFFENSQYGPNILRLENGSNVAYYSPGRQNHFNVVSFDDDGKVLKRHTNLFPQRKPNFSFTVQMNGNFVVNAFFNIDTRAVSFRRTVISLPQIMEDKCIAILTDQDFNYIRHMAYNDSHRNVVAANSSQILFIDGEVVYFYDTSFKLVDRLSNGSIIVDAEMTDERLFALYGDNYLRIFDLKTLDLVKKLSMNFNWTQLGRVSNRFISLYKSKERMLYLYDQEDFEKAKEISVEKTFGPGLTPAMDKTRFVTFYDQTRMKWFSA